MNTITEEEFKRGINLCLENANDLISDAELLLKNNRFQRSYSLFQLASEEVGKGLLIYLNFIFPVSGEEDSFKTFKREFKHHSIKMERIISMEFFLLQMAKDKKTKLAFIKNLYSNLHSIDELNNKKNYSLYTTIINNRFKHPKELISENDVIELKKMTTVRMSLAKSMIEFGLPIIDELKEYSKTVDRNTLIADAAKDLAEDLYPEGEDLFASIAYKK